MNKNKKLDFYEKVEFFKFFMERFFVCKIEDGRAELKIDDLITLCRFYGVSADYFIGLADK